jgi:hypothetical protein
MNPRASLAIALAIFLAVLVQAALSQVALRQIMGDQKKMTLEQNKAIVRDYLNEIVNKGNMAALDSYVPTMLFSTMPGVSNNGFATVAILGAFPTTP